MVQGVQGIQVYEGNKRYAADHGWLKSRFSFSFADYVDPNNMAFGPMRVLNDDIVAPGRGFGAHPHREMEIVSIVLQGQLQHQDSAGHTEVTTFGGIQRMSAGTGIVHSEMNPSEEEDVHFLQLWFEPHTSGLSPSYEKAEFDQAKMVNHLLPVVMANPEGDAARIHQDLTLYLSDLQQGKHLEHVQEPNRKRFLFVIEGELLVNGSIKLGRRDAARMTDVTSIRLDAQSDCRFMLIDLPA
ncbi:pirin family protein [Marinicrinis sediminis]|uniref:Pirin family protein n=1 Tax=Marinicrinis sediminis TaxID=1652465 RepID=A0ABW5REG5_9BACL